MKKKCLITILIVLLTIQIASAICCEKNKECIISETCQEADCGDCLMNIYNRDGTINISNANMTEVTSLTYIYNISKNLSVYGTYPYTINCTKGEYCRGDCQVEVKQECEEQEMEGLAVTIFVMAINAILFLLPFKQRLSNNELANYIMKRCCIIIGLFLLTLNTTIVITIADLSGLGLFDELFRYVWLINWTAYVAIVALFWTTIRGIMKLWEDISRRKRMGDE